jgi:hypothetical protein
MEPDAVLDTWEWADLDGVEPPAGSPVALAQVARAVEVLTGEVTTANQKLDALARQRRDAPLLLSYRAAAALLGIDRGRIPALLRSEVLRDVPCGKGRRIPRVEVERLAVEGIPQNPTAKRTQHVARRQARPPTGDVGASIRALPRGRRAG